MGQIFVAQLAGVCSKEGNMIIYGSIGKFSDAMTEGRSSVRVEEELVERGG